MAPARTASDRWDDDSDDWDDPEDDVDDPEEDDELEMVPCPACGELIYEESEQCPRCGEYVTFSTSPWSGKSTWWIVLGVLGVLGVLWASLQL